MLDRVPEHPPEQIHILADTPHRASQPPVRPPRASMRSARGRTHLLQILQHSVRRATRGRRDGGPDETWTDASAVAHSAVSRSARPAARVASGHCLQSRALGGHAGPHDQPRAAHPAMEPPQLAIAPLCSSSRGRQIRP
jgi:hypothetical protein